MLSSAGLLTVCALLSAPLPGEGFGGPRRFALLEESRLPLAAPLTLDKQASDPRKARIFLATSLLATPALGYLAWWNHHLGVRFHGESEGWFGRDTYSGGADKASHFLAGYAAQPLLASLYERLGYSKSRAGTLGAWNAAFCGLIVEVGDGFSDFGFSWEDASITAFGAAASALIRSRGLEDTVGFRMGLVEQWIFQGAPADSAGQSSLALSSRPPDREARSGYSEFIHTADLKLAGLLPRLRAQPGPARYFLVSFAFRTDGYRFAPPERRERNLGVELGVNTPEVLRSLGVRASTWWGGPLLFLLEHFRLPYTAVGYHYDLNSRRWHGG